LARNITTVVLLASSIALVTMTAAFLTFDSISSHSQLQNRLATLADVVGQNANAAISFNDPIAANEILQALQAEPPVVSGCLYDLSGSLFAQYQRARQLGPQGCPKTLTQMPIVNGEYVRVIRPLLRHSETVGTLSLQSDLHDVKKRWQRLLLIAGALLVVALALGGVSGVFLQRKISQPIANLAHAMHDVTAEQNFEARVPISGSDEIAELGATFNSMLAELHLREMQKRNAEAKLQYQALNDELTGLPNRRLLADRLSQTLAVAAREAHLVAVLYIDLDGFKLVNDSLGHPIGDVLLGQVAARFRSRVRKADTLARIGGDEFTLVLARLASKQEAALVADHLLELLATPFSIDDHKITIGASIGISVFPEDAVDSDILFQQADCAMYAAKRNGKNGVMYYTPALGSSARERMNLESQLRGAVGRGEISLQYQPEFDLSSSGKRLTRFEALARWKHPTLGVIPPSTFIPIAEESGIIVPLGAYLMERACSEAVTWQATAPLPIQVAVNVSSIQFSRKNFMEEVIGILNRTGLNPTLLQIELTESIMLSGTNDAVEMMKRLGALGVSFAIDDFGTGYSCLSYLPRLPFNALKIDRSFVTQLESTPGTRAMVNSLIALAHNLGMRVIVEGVERLEQMELIQELGGDEIQGYLLGRPTSDPAKHVLQFQEDLRAMGEDFAHELTLGRDGACEPSRDPATTVAFSALVRPPCRS
jgi:diguanylate cyclase (GGDEF)-like protein